MRRVVGSDLTRPVEVKDIILLGMHFEGLVLSGCSAAWMWEVRVVSVEDDPSWLDG